MILDQIKNIDNYESVIPKAIIEMAKAAKGDDIHLKKEYEKQFEMHKKHKDLFVCLEGRARFCILVLLYDESKDFCVVDDYQRTVELSAGEFLLINEYVLHKPNLIPKTKENAQKTAKISVIKIEV
jgi:beta-galactosidase beta subunit